MSLKEIFYSLLTGLVMGGVFSGLKLPIPAPTAFSGIVGIFGIYLGYVLVQKFYR